jgi:two-component system sensor kinase FixL
MSAVTIIWSMFASACLTMAVIYFLVWYRSRAEWAHLWFSLLAVSAAGFAYAELVMMTASTPAEFLSAMLWAHIPLFVWLVSITWFVKVYLAAGRTWLAWTITGIRAAFLLPTLLTGVHPNYLEMTGLRHIQFLGESVAVASGVPNPWTLVGQFATLLIMAFVADASITAWRRGDRRKALMIGGSVEFFIIAGLGSSMLLVWADAELPIVYSVVNLGLVVVMAFELSRDVLRAGELVEELKASEVGLRESEERMALAVEVADLAIWTLDLDRNNIWVSDRWRELFGYPASERLDGEAIRQRVHPDDLPAVNAAQERALAGANGGAYQIEYRLRMPDGSERWLSSHGRVETNAEGRPIRMRGASRDITTRKRREQEMLLLRQEVAHVGRVSMLGQLSSSLAHEINQPLGAILRNAEAAELFLNHPSPDLDEIRAILGDIRKDDQRAGAVIDRMRGLLKRHGIEARPLDISDLLSEVSALVRVDAQARQVTMTLDVPRDLPAVRGDRVHLQQVLLNLLINGMDALADIRPGDRRLQVSARLNGGGTLEVGVTDSGPGVPADQLAQVFEAFYTTKASGMGMGLPISRTIIEAHGGKLWAENAAAGGAVFRFTLPVVQKETAPV